MLYFSCNWYLLFCFASVKETVITWKSAIHRPYRPINHNSMVLTILTSYCWVWNFNLTCHCSVPNLMNAIYDVECNGVNILHFLLLLHTLTSCVIPMISIQRSVCSMLVSKSEFCLPFFLLEISLFPFSIENVYFFPDIIMV